jgi:hypothetical protein
MVKQMWYIKNALPEETKIQLSLDKWKQIPILSPPFQFQILLANH